MLETAESGEKGNFSFPAIFGSIIVGREWSEGGGDSRSILGRKSSAQLEVEELGSGCESDIGGEGGGWLGDLKLTGGREE